MSYRIDEIEGIGPSYGQKLQAAGFTTTEALLEACRTPAGRKGLAETTGISSKLLLGWANMADLMRINGIGKQFAELLEGAGVDTVKELATRNAANLTAKMIEVNAERKLAKTSPVETQVTEWVNQAKGLEPMISY